MVNVKSSIIIKHSLLALFISAVILSIPLFFAGAENLSAVCQIEAIEQKKQALSSAEYRQLLEKCDKYYQEEIGKINSDITKTEQEKKTLKNKISGLSQKIKTLNFQISQNNLVINALGVQIEDTTYSIEKTSLKIEDSKEKLSTILQSINEEDQRPIIEILFIEDDLSDFFDNVLALEILNSENKDLLQNIRALKASLDQQKQSLDTEKDDLENVVKVRTIQKEESAKTKQDQEYYLKLTEEEYQKQLKEKQETAKKVAEIRARIFELVGVSKAPTFGEAYEIAKNVSSITGVRPAFLLAVLQQESAIGKNVGQCVLADATTGDGKRIRDGSIVSRVMKPTRDVHPFLSICQEVGRDPYNTPVSCPMSVGWGGAMGPAQFIPSTWMLFKDRVQATTGRAPNPWGINDAFLAAGLYLADNGAGAKTSDSERRAALIYFSGSASNSSFNFYANSVLKIAAGFENDIALIEGK